MEVYNTLGGIKEELKTLSPHEVKIYVCGPTTYNLIHLGNARPLVVFDGLRRYLEYRGYAVKYIQNFTDVDDKIIKRAAEEGQDPLELAARYIEEYFVDADALNIKRATAHPRVSQHIPDIVAAVAGLIEKGYAYNIDGDIYYRVQSFSGYGKLSGRSRDEMQAGARVEVNERKEDPADFALWKKAKAGEPAWDSPWGQGRPGWHIECSVMATKYLGETVDIHGGGSDLIFPHHENEIAQAEALTGLPFVRYWMHNGFITVNKEKMSKSLGNFFLIRDILDQFPPDVVRFYLIATHYRSPLDFDDTKLEEAGRALTRLKTTLRLTREFLGGDDPVEDDGQADPAFIQKLQELEQNFQEALDDDFNTALAVGHLFSLSHLLNTYVSGARNDHPAERQAAFLGLNLLKNLGDILGIFMESRVGNDLPVDGIIELLTEIRRQLRLDRDFNRADEIRDFLLQQGVKVEDTGQGGRCHYEEAPAFDMLVDKLLSLRAGFKQSREYDKADSIRQGLLKVGIVVEDTREGARWKLAQS